MADIRVGCALITWIQFTPGGRTGLDEEAILGEIARAGYEGAPVSVKEGRSAEETLTLYARHGLAPAPGYLGGTWGGDKSREEVLEQAAQYAHFMRAVGCTELYVAAGGGNFVSSRGKTRRELAGHVQPGDGLSREEYERYADLLNAIGAITAREGVASCFHNHVGTVIETREEMDTLLSLTDPALVFVGPDTGHLAWAGADPVAFCRDYADRIRSIHLKDCYADVIARGRAEGWDYPTFSAHRVFAELGEGCVDFPAIFRVLRDANFSGWAIQETDRTRKPTAAESVTISRAYLRDVIGV